MRHIIVCALAAAALCKFCRMWAGNLTKRRRRETHHLKCNETCEKFKYQRDGPRNLQLQEMRRCQATPQESKTDSKHVWKLDGKLSKKHVQIVDKWLIDKECAQRRDKLIPQNIDKQVQLLKKKEARSSSSFCLFYLENEGKCIKNKCKIIQNICTPY